MSYATQTDMVTRFGEPELIQRTDLEEGLAINPEVLGRALADADAEIDSYLATRYTLPLVSTPPVVNRLACEIAHYRLYDAVVPPPVRLHYEDAVALLRRLSSGEVLLAGHQGVAVAGVHMAYHSFGARQITDDSLRGFA